MGEVDAAPELEEVLLAQGGNLVVGEDREELVRRGVREEFAAEGFQPVAKADGLRHGVAADFVVKAVAEELRKLDAEQPSLGKHPALALNHVTEVVVDVRVVDDKGFADQAAHLRPADVEDIREPREVFNGDVVAVGSERRGQAGAVHVERDAELMTDFADGGQFFLAVERAELGRLADVDEAGLDFVLVGLVVIVGADQAFDLFGVDLAVLRGDGQNFVTGAFDRAGFMYGNVARGRGNRALIGTERRGDDGDIRRGPADHEVHGGVGAPDALADQVRGFGAVFILAVADRLFQVGAVERFHDSRMRAFAVVIHKADHVFPFLSRVTADRRPIHLCLDR